MVGLPLCRCRGCSSRLRSGLQRLSRYLAAQGLFFCFVVFLPTVVNSSEFRCEHEVCVCRRAPPEFSLPNTPHLGQSVDGEHAQALAERKGTVVYLYRVRQPAYTRQRCDDMTTENEAAAASLLLLKYELSLHSTAV